MNLFGTDGIRNHVGHYPFTSETLPRLGRALAVWAEEKYGDKASFLLAADTRYSGPWIKAGLLSGLLRHPITVYDANILPTPGLFHLMKADERFTCGIIISASHNPAEDNGIKIVDVRTGKLTPEDEERITALLQVQEKECDFKSLGKLMYFLEAQDLYSKALLNLFPKNFLQGQKIVIDCANGATSECAPVIFKALGADTIVINNTPDGHNINKNSGAVYVKSLQRAVIKHKAALGVAFDGDGDRVIAVNKAGKIKDGDDLLALLLTHADYKEQSAIVATVMSNQGFEAYLTTLGKKLIRTSVGDKYVCDALLQNDLMLGGEPSGHIILNNIITTGDGILVALKVLETMIQTNNFALESFAKFPQMLINVPIKQKMDLSVPPLSDFITEEKNRLNAGRLVVRYSGTESIVRVMVEDEDSVLTKTVAENLAQKLQTILS